MVGDADQSIYAFRGATIRNILEFERDYPDARTILLEQNYRSTQKILTAANAVIARNERASRRTSGPTRATVPRSSVTWPTTSTTRPCSWPRRSIGSATRRASRPATSRCSIAPTRSPGCSRRSSSAPACPTRWSAGVRFYERKEVRDLLAYLRVLANPADVVSMRRILNVPKRGIGDRAEAMLEALASRERISFWDALRRAEEASGMATRSLNAVREFVAMIEELTARPRACRRSALAEEVLVAHRLPRRAGGVGGSAGREPAGKPQRAHLGGLGVRGGQSRGHAGGVPGAGVAGGRRRPDPREPTAGRAWSR